MKLKRILVVEVTNWHLKSRKNNVKNSFKTFKLSVYTIIVLVLLFELLLWRKLICWLWFDFDISTMATLKSARMQ